MRPPRSTQGRSSAASDVYKRQFEESVDPLLHPTFLKLKKLVGAGNMEEVALLVAGLDLEVVGWWKG